MRLHTKQLALPTPFWLSWWGCPIHSLERRCLFCTNFDLDEVIKPYSHSEGVSKC